MFWKCLNDPRIEAGFAMNCDVLDHPGSDRSMSGKAGNLLKTTWRGIERNRDKWRAVHGQTTEKKSKNVAVKRIWPPKINKNLRGNRREKDKSNGVI